MTAKQIAYDIDARERMLRGIQKLAKAVKTTLGPSGRVVVLDGVHKLLAGVCPRSLVRLVRAAVYDLDAVGPLDQVYAAAHRAGHL